LLQRFLSGGAVIDPQSDRYVNQVHRDDIAAALFHLLDRPRPTKEIYNVVDDEPILQSECYRWLAQKLNRPVPPIASPPFGRTRPVARSTSTAKRGRSNKRVNNAKLRATGWAPRYPTFAEAMGKSILPGWSY